MAIAWGNAVLMLTAVAWIERWPENVSAEFDVRRVGV
jgi:hypothetical protein